MQAGSGDDNPIASGAKAYTPALGSAPMRLYDLALRIFTREQAWRAAVLRQLAPIAGEKLIGVGCGTGTLILAIARLQPAARTFGRDPDPEALQMARSKAEKAGIANEFRLGFADETAAQGQFGALTCTLVLHQIPLAGKRAALAAMFAALEPGGRLVIADYSLQRSWLMRTLFRLKVQRIDGRADTQPNADGILPRLIEEAGFVDVNEAAIVATPSGSISVFTACRAPFGPTAR